jgi:hypothetical protein
MITSHHDSSPRHPFSHPIALSFPSPRGDIQIPPQLPPSAPPHVRPRLPFPSQSKNNSPNRKCAIHPEHLHGQGICLTGGLRRRSSRAFGGAINGGAIRDGRWDYLRDFDAGIEPAGRRAPFTSSAAPVERVLRTSTSQRCTKAGKSRITSRLT